MPIFIGDVHGKYTQYKRIIKEHQNTIQVGDMGVGFIRWPNGDAISNPPFDQMVATNARFIRGNHDNPAVCYNHMQCIRDGTIEDGMMFIGGADSIDKAYRVEGYSWWPDEELSRQELDNMVTKYAQARPEIMVTHDAPQNIAVMIHATLIQLKVPMTVTRTRDTFEQMLAIHRPRIWVFGHWHVSLDYLSEGTRFVCLNELEVKELT